MLVLDLFVAHPTEQFSLAEIQRRTGINAASTHALLATMSSRGYVQRNTVTKAYSLGPAAVAVGEIALGQLPAVREARAHLSALGAALDLEVLVTAVAGDQVIFVGRSAGTSELGSIIQVGQRVPLRPPVGALFFAWEPDDVVEEWMDRAEPTLTSDERAELSTALEAMRRLGFAAVLETPVTEEMARLVNMSQDVNDASSIAALDRVLTDLAQSTYYLLNVELDGRYDVYHLAAPIFDTAGRVAATIAVNGLPARTTGSDVLAIADRVLGTAKLITKNIFGKTPIDDPGRRVTRRSAAS